MPRKREIHFGFFTNEDIAELNPLARLMLIGLWNLADREGRLEDRPKKLRAEILPYDNCDGEELLSAIAAKGFIMRYEVGGTRYIQVNNWHKYQNVHPRETESNIPAIPSKDQTNAQGEPKDNPMGAEGSPVNPYPSFPSFPSYTSIPSFDDEDTRAREDVPPAKTQESETASEVFTLVQKEFGPIRSGIEADFIKDWLQFYSREWIIQAIRLAVLNKARNSRYVDKVLQGWKAKGYSPGDKPWEDSTYDKHDIYRNMNSPDNAISSVVQQIKAARGIGS